MKKSAAKGKGNLNNPNIHYAHVIRKIISFQIN